jgi:hypothetical protein
MIADCQFPIADFEIQEIGNWQSEIGNELCPNF